MKAHELWKIKKYGVYQKRAKEDLVSIVKGIRGWKGRIHYSFTPVLRGEWADAQQVAEAVDAAIHRAYRLWPSNYIAYDQLQGESKYGDRYNEDQKEAFLSRCSALPEEIRKVAWEGYARPVINHEKAQ